MAQKLLNRTLRSILRHADVQRLRGASDRELLRQFVIANNETAFRIIAERHGPMVMGVCSRMLGCPHDAEDAFQATLLVLAQRAASIRKSSSLASWLYGVARRVAMKQQRAKRRRHNRETAMRDSFDQPADDPTWTEIKTGLDEELDRLPPAFREVLVLCYLEGLTRDEAARRIGATSGVVKGRLERARTMLAQRLSKRGITLSAGLLAVAVSPDICFAITRDIFLLAANSAGDVATANVISLANETMREMAMSKAKSICVGLVCTLVATIGIGVAQSFAGDDEPNGIKIKLQKLKKDGPEKPELGPKTVRFGDPHSIEAHDKPASHVRHSADGSVLVTAGYGGRSLKLWDPGKQKLIREISWAKSVVAAVAISPDGKRVVAGCWNKRLHLWNVADGNLLRTVVLRGVPTDIAFSPNRRNLAVGYHTDHAIEIRDANTGILIESFSVPMKKPKVGTNSHSLVRYSSDGKLLVVACGGRGWPKYVGDDSVVAIWDTHTMRLRARFTAGKNTVADLVISPDGKTIAAVCFKSKTIKLWNTPPPDENKAVHTETIKEWIKDLDSAIFRKREAADKKLRTIGPAAAQFLVEAAQSESAEIQSRVKRIFRNLDIRPERVLPTAHYDQNTLAFSPDGKFLAHGRRSPNRESLRLWHLQETQKPIVAPKAAGGCAVSFSPDGKQIVTGNANGSISMIGVKSLGKK